MGRDVGAVPGPVTSAASSGTNSLLQSGDARVMTNASDITRQGTENAPKRNVIHLGASRAIVPDSRVL